MAPFKTNWASTTKNGTIPLKLKGFHLLIKFIKTNNNLVIPLRISLTCSMAILLENLKHGQSTSRIRVST